MDGSLSLARVEAMSKAAMPLHSMFWQKRKVQAIRDEIQSSTRIISNLDSTPVIKNR
jgi:hypothetical protein